MGFVDGEGSFMVNLRSAGDVKSGFQVIATFVITLHEKDIALLHGIESFFGVGKVRSYSKHGFVVYSVSALKDLANVIIPFFEKYPLLTQKRADFLLFKSVVELMSNKEHLNTQGIQNIMSIKSVLNKGLNETLRKRFPNIIPSTRPLVETTEIPDNNWIAGFTEAEGCFGLTISSCNNRVGFAVRLRFRLTQHVRDTKLLKVIVNHLSCGIVSTDTNNFAAMRLDVRKFSDLLLVIKPFFNKYPLHGSKRLDYESFIKIVDIMERKEHLTQEGLAKIRLIKAGMNNGRDYSN